MEKLVISIKTRVILLNNLARKYKHYMWIDGIIVIPKPINVNALQSKKISSIYMESEHAFFN